MSVPLRLTRLRAGFGPLIHRAFFVELVLSAVLPFASSYCLISHLTLVFSVQDSRGYSHERAEEHFEEQHDFQGRDRSRRVTYDPTVYGSFWLLIYIRKGKF